MDFKSEIAEILVNQDKIAIRTISGHEILLNPVNIDHLKKALDTPTLIEARYTYDRFARFGCTSCGDAPAIS